MADFALTDLIDLRSAREWVASSGLGLGGEAPGDGARATRSPSEAAHPPSEATRPPFEMAVRFWRAHLDVIRPEEQLTWVFRENLRLGGVGRDHLSTTVTVCPDAPRFDRADAAAVYEHAHAAGCRELCFELLYAAPGQVYATLRRGSGLEPFTLDRDDWDLEFQLAPTFHAVTEVDDREALNAASRAAPIADDLLGDILIGGDIQ